jgi:hypothetical protein
MMRKDCLRLTGLRGPYVQRIRTGDSPPAPGRADTGVPEPKARRRLPVEDTHDGSGHGGFDAGVQVPQADPVRPNLYDGAALKRGGKCFGEARRRTY